MYSLSDCETIYREIKENRTDVQYDIFRDFMVAKFPETAGIFKKFDTPAICEFVNKTRYDIYDDMSNVFEKGAECREYYFVLNGKFVFNPPR
jgi:hypothetical protein